jgi:hypothetical protein
MLAILQMQRQTTFVCVQFYGPIGRKQTADEMCQMQARQRFAQFSLPEKTCELRLTRLADSEPVYLHVI